MRSLHLASLGLCFGLVVGPASASPWPREPGSNFVAPSYEVDRDGNSHTGLYGEYGLRPRTTLGYEIGRTNVGETSALLWLQRAMDSGEGRHRLAMSVGVGAIRREGVNMPVVMTGIGWGRGFEGFRDGGWFAAEMRVKILGLRPTPDRPLSDAQSAFLTPEMTTKAEFTFGLRPRQGTTLVNQLRLEQRKDEDLSAKLAVSVVQRVAGPANLELGVIAPVAGPGEAALKIGSWLEF
ncbi:hypothetical protein [Paracoccus salsus]|uniref:hypothetical protein n=1 Tax=Paracoccus salsus TaxID=2911061 RepID=UPI001F485987|nr:hypothetical protein [Paracoccus salsus]MCF3973578.1 hypothetical protein [Paracoccus salsus]